MTQKYKTIFKFCHFECNKCKYIITTVGVNKIYWPFKKWECVNCKDPDSWYTYQLTRGAVPTDYNLWCSPVRDSYFKIKDTTRSALEEMRDVE